MTSGSRMFLNVFATYGRSLYALIVGLFTSRWVIASLGEIDYGLVGLVGGLIAFVSFFNNLLSFAVVRFYAVSVGSIATVKDNVWAIEDCRQWFSVAVFIHTVVPIVLVIVGYPIGEWLVRAFLTIPSDRVEACVWIWRFTCISCFVGMVNVPFQAMYTAKQEIAELTIYSVIATTCNFLFCGYMVAHPGFWLVKYSFATCVISVVPQLFIGVNAILRYRECRLKFRYMWNFIKIKQILSYAGAKLWNNLGAVFSSQGHAIIINKFLGPRFNASMSVAHTIAVHTSTLSLALGNGYWPAIANSSGAKDEVRVKQLTFQFCRLGTVMLLLFALPVSLEMYEVMRLWLGTPPVFAVEICIAILIGMVLGNLCDGYWMAVMAIGKGVWLYNFIVGWAGFVSLGLVITLFWLGFGMWSLCISLVASSCVTLVLRLWLGRKLLGYSIRYWFRTVCIPVAMLTLVAGIAGLPSLIIMSPSFTRIVVTSVCCVSVLLCCAWRFILTAEEKNKVFAKLVTFVKGFKK